MLIPEHPSWEIKDSSKLDTFQDCERKYLFEHLLGWRSDRPAHDLYFGESWHRAREYQLIHGYDDIQGAYKAFIDYYRKEFPESTDAIYRPKDPMGVIIALQKFAEEKQRDLKDNELLFTETSGTVPVDMKGRILHYRMDSILRSKETGKVFSWDHKSAKGFPWQWEANFYLSIQNGTYTHCLYCMYPIEEVIGIEFCGTAFKFLKRKQKYEINLKRVPAWKTPEQMNIWLWTVNDKLDNIEREMDRLSHCKESDEVLMAFPMRTSSCQKYYGCQFKDYCMAWTNPLRNCHEPPLGFHIKFWDPRELNTTNKMNLEWK